MTADLRPYPEYKESGLPWLGSIPKHWEIRRGKYLFRCVDVRSSAGDEELLTVSSKRGVVARNTTKVTMFKAESYIGHKLCWPNDLVINSLWAWARGLGVTKHHGIISSAYGVYRLQRGFESYADFIHHLVRSAAFHWELQVRSKGIWISRLQLTDEAFLGAPFPLPSPSEAKKVVRFIASIEHRINRFIRNRRRLIVALNEQKRAIIDRYVTRGLDPCAPFKPSRIEWLGDIPEHWNCIRLKYLATVEL
jgi:type I restriction enzyme S subunit